MRVPACAVLFCFVWMVAEPWVYSKEYQKAVAQDWQQQTGIPANADMQFASVKGVAGKATAGGKGGQSQQSAAPEDKWPELMQRLDDSVFGGDSGKAGSGNKTASGSRAKAEDVDTVMSDIEKEQKNVMKELKSNREMLVKMKASKVLFDRQDAMEKAVKGKFDELKKGTEGLKSGNKAKRERSKQNIRKMLDDAKPKRLVKLDPNNLPNKRITDKDIKKKEPRKGGKYGKLWRKDRIRLVSAGDPGRALAGAQPHMILASYSPTGAPDSEDLEQTIETKATDDIIELADTQLSCDPVAMYNWVHNNIDYVPYFGSMKGANETLWQKEANDMDQASLLIAMYRHCGIPARYVVGTVEVPIEKAMNWAGGFTDKNAALTAFYYGGIPLRPIFEGGKFTKIRMEHVWVEAWLSVDRYRGAKDPGAEAYNPNDPYAEARTWTYMDPSFKYITFVNSNNTVDQINFDIPMMVNDLYSAISTNDTTGEISGFDQIKYNEYIQNFKQSAYDYFAENPTISSESDLINKKVITPQKISTLNGNITLKIINEIERYSEILEGYRYHFGFKIIEATNITSNYDVEETDIMSEYRVPMVILASKRITLSYSAASEDDNNIVQSLINQNPSPKFISTYLYQIKPQLLVDGEIVKEGETGKVGVIQKSITAIYHPKNGTLNDFTFEKDLDSGNYYAIGLKMGLPSENALKMKYDNWIDIQNKIKANQNVVKDDSFGEFIHIIAFLYLRNEEKNARLLGKMGSIYYYSSPSIAYCQTEMNKNVIFGLVYSARIANYVMDVHARSVSLPIDNDEIYSRFVLQLQNAVSSYFEGAIFNVMLNNANPISTVALFKMAAEQNQSFYVIDNNNVENALQCLNGVSTELKRTIRNAVQGGLIVTIHNMPIISGNWAGYGYTLFDPKNEATSFMIEGNVLGGDSGCPNAINYKATHYYAGANCEDALDNLIAKITTNPKDPLSANILSFVLSIAGNLIIDSTITKDDVCSCCNACCLKGFVAFAIAEFIGTFILLTTKIYTASGLITESGAIRWSNLSFGIAFLGLMAYALHLIYACKNIEDEYGQKADCDCGFVGAYSCKKQ